MKEINLKQMLEIQAGDAADDFCKGYLAAAAIYQVGVWANWWNPVGWVAGGIGAAIAAGCAINNLT